MRRNGWVIVVAALVFSQALFLVTAMAAKPAAMKSQEEPSKEEADAYKAWFDANAAKDVPKAMELAKAYLQKYPNGKYAKYLKETFIPRTRGGLFNAAMNSKNTGEMIRICNEALADDPDNLDYLYLMAYTLRTNELFASPPNFSHGSEAATFSERAIKLIEGGKVPNVVPKDKWNKNTTLSWLYQNLAVVDAGAKKDNDKALTHFAKASELDPTEPYNFLAVGSIYQGRYLEATKKFQALPEDQRNAPDPKPAQVQALLDGVNKAADDVINTFARFLAVTTNNASYAQQRSSVEKVVTELYKYRHPESPDGLQKLIEQYAKP
ncbi:MAG TPA: hypothetical protein VFV34_07905 [Blastocatellia bacterium]|nr:hypothetical protein [Blastocatellia bacterium]